MIKVSHIGSVLQGCQKFYLCDFSQPIIQFEEINGKNKRKTYHPATYIRSDILLSFRNVGIRPRLTSFRPSSRLSSSYILPFYH